MRSYLRSAFPSVHDVDDVVQESYLRIWRSRTEQPIQSAKAFLFCIARRIAIDVIRRNKTSQNDAVANLDVSCVLEEGVNVVETVSRRQEIALLAEAIDALPSQCRKIMVLRKIEGLSHREIASRLGITEATVHAQLQRGMQKCMAYLHQHGVKSS